MCRMKEGNSRLMMGGTGGLLKERLGLQFESKISGNWLGRPTKSSGGCSTNVGRRKRKGGLAGSPETANGLHVVTKTKKKRKQKNQICERPATTPGAKKRQAVEQYRNIPEIKPQKTPTEGGGGGGAGGGQKEGHIRSPGGT